MAAPLTGITGSADYSRGSSPDTPRWKCCLVPLKIGEW